ncbi:distal tail protein Dit [Lacticaseibacillus paracasei]|uniref:distal tail protein Dit n=1 Tax=Lacticaseibacillus paracasei TaxID=1597 RepID=UPI00237F5090|nr:distal tail protein Dit [Lacticaseibacillus paracasei]MDE3285495.1 phage tail family protein [Lacticaseibacillus paracasei]
MKQAGMKITYAGVDITQWMYVQMVKRDVGTNHVNTMQKVGISDGQMLQYMSRDVKTIVVTGIIVNDDLVPLRRSLAAAIDTDEPQQLIFGDEPDKYYLAIVDSQPAFTEGFRSGTISISFVCPDGGIAHSVATKTFDNMPYKDTSNLLLEDPVGTQVATGDDWPITTIGHFNGKPGKQYTASVNLEQLDNTVSFQAWTGDANGVRQNLISTVAFSATGKATITFIAPENIDYSTILLQLACFNGNASGSYSWSETKVELGDKATPYKDVPVNFAIASHGFASNTDQFDAYPITVQLSEDLSGKTITTTVKVSVTNYQGKIDSSAGIDSYIDIKDAGSTGNWTGIINQIPITENGVYTSSPKTIVKNLLTGTTNQISLEMFNLNATIEVWIKVEIGTSASPWSPNPADPEYYTNTVTVHNGGTYPVEPVITATMHADNGMVGIVNDRPGILQFGTQEIDGFTTEESEVALDLAAVQGSHMDNQAATNNPYWGGDPSMPNEQIGNAIWTQDSYDGWKVEPNWPSITGTHLYWNGPSIKHDLAQTHNGDFKSNLTWDVMTRFQTGVAQVGALETTLESDGKPIFQMILKDNSALSDQLWWMCYYKDQLVVNEQLDRSIFTNDKFIQLELQKFGNSVVFRVSPWVGNQGRETTITRQFTFADAASVETKQFSAWFMRDKTWGESTMYLIASTVKWQNVSWYTDIKNRFSNGDVITIDVANTKTYFNGSEDRTLHTLGNQWDKFILPPGDTIIQLMPSSWAQPFECEVYLKEAWL